VLVTLVTLLPERSDNISERAQALINVLRLPQAVLVLPSAARVEPLAAGEIDEVQRAHAYLAGVRVGAADPQREDRVRARGALVHQRRCDRAPRIGRREQRADLCGRAEWLDHHVRDARGTPFFVLDLMLLLVEFAFSQEVSDGFVVLRWGLRYCIYAWKWSTYYLKELAFHGVFPTLTFQLFSNLENLVYSAGYHAHGLLCLYDAIVGHLRQ
jgi:hypothetical protein